MNKTHTEKTHAATTHPDPLHTIEQIKSARELVRQALAGCVLPQIQNSLRQADMELHWALWNLAEPGTLFPEAGEE